MPLPQENRKYTHADYLTWPNDERWKIIDGIPYMQATPSWEHQSISLELSRQFANYLLDKSCRAFTAPFDLTIPEENKKEDDSTNVVQPDLVVVCNKDDLKGTGYYGVPSLISV